MHFSSHDLIPPGAMGENCTLINILIFFHAPVMNKNPRLQRTQHSAPNESNKKDEDKHLM
jgi:hypothetical protein